jgi:membrane protein DedA with SNARE-associated domain
MIPDLWRFAGLFVLAFLSEDAAVLSGAFLAAADLMVLAPAFLACLGGVWVGDLGLYFLARSFGRPLVDRLWARNAKMRGRLAKSEDWFRRRGIFALALCRVIPGTRLPTYLSAGLLRMPVGAFAVITGALAAVWVAVVFGLVRLAGSAAPGIMEILKQHAALTGGILVATVIALPYFATLFRRVKNSAWLRRWRQWEFWPAWLFYAPVAGHYLRLAIKYRGLSLPTCANPGMFTGGLIGESKYATLRDLQSTSPDWVAPSFLLASGPERLRELERLMERGQLEFPLVLKPDVAQRGSGFKVIRSLTEAAAYLSAVSVPVVAQKYIPGPREAGVFYYRFPHEPCGQIFAITEKIFPVIFGDGRRTVEELIRADSRAALLAPVYLRRFQERRKFVPAFGESLRLVEAGNHAQGCIFRDGRLLWSEQLEARIDEISRGLPGFYIGRYDVRFGSVEEFQQGRGFSILELNGAASEATSAYDATKSLRDAYRLLFQQWELVFAIGAANRRLGCRADSVRTLLSEWRRYRSLSLCHPAAD